MVLLLLLATTTLKVRRACYCYYYCYLEGEQQPAGEAVPLAHRPVEAGGVQEVPAVVQPVRFQVSTHVARCRNLMSEESAVWAAHPQCSTGPAMAFDAAGPALPTHTNCSDAAGPAPPCAGAGRRKLRLSTRTEAVRVLNALSTAALTLTPDLLLYAADQHDSRAAGVEVLLSAQRLELVHAHLARVQLQLHRDNCHRHHPSGPVPHELTLQGACRGQVRP